ncbi:MAG: type II toxin-antitoxin system VapB family antitoxin [Acidobacteriota bacterium]|nr:type II toxin-antitoxin system VapB family antitoxin [Acidobacteriota bacterium]
MSRMTVTIDDALLEEAKKALGVETHAEAIRIALKEAVRRRRLAQALRQRGQFELRGDLAELRRLREEGCSLRLRTATRMLVTPCRGA